MIGQGWVLAGCVVLGIGSVWGVQLYGSSKYDEGYAASTVHHEALANKAALDAQRQLRETETLWRAKNAEDDQRYQEQLQGLERRYAAGALPPVRVCEQPSRATGGDRLPGAATPAGISDGAPADRLPGDVAGRDIGPGLEAIGKIAEKQAYDLIRLQRYVEAVTNEVEELRAAQEAQRGS